jgi:hypothetical protein
MFTFFLLFPMEEVLEFGEEVRGITFAEVYE